MKSWIAFAIGGLIAALLATAVYKKFVEEPVQLASNTNPGDPADPVPPPPAPPELPPATDPAPQPGPTGPPPVVNPTGSPIPVNPVPTPPPPVAPGRRPPTLPPPNPTPRPTSNPGEMTPPSPPIDPHAPPAHSEPAPVAPPVAPPPAPVPPPPPPRVAKTVTVSEGTLIAARVMEKISSETHKDGDSFSATLDQPLVIDGFVIADRGARLQGKVAQSVQAGRVKGVAQLVVELTSLTTADGQTVAIHTAGFAKEGPKSTGSDATKVGIGAGIGAAIGAIAGGGKGAAIGAAAGAGAGTGAVVATRGKPAEIPVETRITFRVSDPVKITERLK